MSPAGISSNRDEIGNYLRTMELWLFSPALSAGGRGFPGATSTLPRATSTLPRAGLSPAPELEPRCPAGLIGLTTDPQTDTRNPAANEGLHFTFVPCTIYPINLIPEFCQLEVILHRSWNDLTWFGLTSQFYFMHHRISCDSSSKRTETWHMLGEGWNQP